MYPHEVEDVLAQHPHVQDVAVVGRPSEEWGEVVTAFVILAPGAALDTDDLEQHCRKTLAGFKLPRSWRVVDELPRNAAGKVVKHEIPA